MMAETVWKFQIAEDYLTTLELPSGAQPLTAQVQDGDIQMWARLDPDQPRETWKFFLLPTGGTLFPGAHHYLATVQLYGGRIAAHIFYALPGELS